MKKRDPQKQAKKQKAALKRALYVKTRKNKTHSAHGKNIVNHDKSAASE